MSVTFAELTCLALALNLLDYVGPLATFQDWRVPPVRGIIDLLFNVFWICLAWVLEKRARTAGSKQVREERGDPIVVHTEQETC